MNSPQQQPHKAERQPTGVCPHAAMLNQQGIGPSSRMCWESVLDAEARNAKLPELHAAEAGKFAALARRITPPNLVAQYVQEQCSGYPVIPLLELFIVSKAFLTNYQTADFGDTNVPAGEFLPYRFPATVVKGYFEFCRRDQNLFLACTYLTVILRRYVQDLAQQISDPATVKEMLGFGLQFDAANLVTIFPVALYQSLMTLRGAKATALQIDNQVILDALTTIHKNHQFAHPLFAVGDKRTDGPRAILRCPMEGFLFDLLGRYDVLECIISAAHRADTDLRAPSERALRNLMLLSVHQNNREAVRDCAEAALDLISHRAAHS